MGPDLSQRADGLSERMDDPGCDPVRLFATYREFARTNRLLAGWRTCYVRLIRPLLRADESRTLLDIGFGGGDIPRLLARWARRDGLLLEITAIEQDPRALAYVRTLPACPGVTFRHADLADLSQANASFDFVITNHVLHHLDRAGLAVFRDRVESLTRRRAILNDIRRSPLAYALFCAASRWLARGSFTREDGLVSIRRAFTRGELAAALGPRWHVGTARWFRIVATFTP